MEFFVITAPYLIGYTVISFIFWMINSCVAGYNGIDWSLKDVKDSILWPASIAVLIGLVIRIVVNKRKAKKQTK